MASSRRALASVLAKAGPLAKRRATSARQPVWLPDLPLDPPPEPQPAPRAASLTSKTFWSLMDRWGVGEQTALDLIDESRVIDTSARRPRFRLTADQTRRLEYLLDIDANLSESWGPSGGGKWLARRNPAPVFSGVSPLEHMIRRGLPGIGEVLRFLHHWGLKQSLRLRAST